MKKIVLNISDSSYEKFRLEAIREKKSVQEIIRERLLSKPFHKEVCESFDGWLSQELEKMISEE
jgi:hypothetical protein